MSYYIGIDGGGTSTIFCLADCNGNVIDIIKLKSTNYHVMGIEETKETIKNAIDFFTEKKSISLNEIKSICFGGSGVDSEKCKETIINIFRDIGYRNELQVYNDSVIALVGANDGYNGGIIISGTGSVGLVIDKKNRLNKVGGWGHILDDGGSGYFIGREALSKIMKNYDGRECKTLLWDKIREKLKINNQEEIINFVYKDKLPKKDIAGLAPIVIELYNKDKVAKDIVNSAVDSLTIMVETLIEKAQGADISIGLYGSILTKSNIIRDKLIERVNSKHPKVNIHLPYKEAYIGAVDIATRRVKIQN
ncbi:N-acetylglucosamine kinase Nagk [Gottschalkia acidurici 9a]|uniref:N-acetylglucosamine kinase Nagk n=1 Tax=Gottschalkia acidurici (strain ATCC 7906 / DSM 604 / BCRC 14475 / CIP 104303 / KCTC 5404 / NCIMB 10678 / 9a) TaxID=1128398 RepID=K0AWA9_GOTA9|nr:BadF/BadG/BcrA/BcrD ATPase family protein [Gottschalkia acidurici]AFS78143.1 N-acetylglucosamine kinase Nagk [Gottschalkia acidurici 9a]